MQVTVTVIFCGDRPPALRQCLNKYKYNLEHLDCCWADIDEMAICNTITVQYFGLIYW